MSGLFIDEPASSNASIDPHPPGCNVALDQSNDPGSPSPQALATNGPGEAGCRDEKSRPMLTEFRLGGKTEKLRGHRFRHDSRRRQNPLPR
jgi:hypothetical protein